MKRTTIVVLFAMLLCGMGISVKGQSKHHGAPRAVLNYNAEKQAGQINYNSSFFVFGHNLNSGEKEACMERVKADPSFSALQLLDANGVQDMLVILEVQARSTEDLALKLRKLLKEIGIDRIEYNGELMPIAEFKL